MSERGVFSWASPWVRWSVVWLVVLMLVTLLVAFIWLPSVHADFSAQGIWASICRAAGVPSQWAGDTSATKSKIRTTNVVLEPSMSGRGSKEAAGHGATIALQQCTMCHGAQGVSVADAPNLAGQYREVIIKQLIDYRSGDRPSSVMQALSANLNDDQIDDLAAYYASLPKVRNTPSPYESDVPALVKWGDPLRNIAPCATCHGGIDRKLGTPWLEGMPKQYLADQLKAFASGSRHNDSLAQMRNMARAMNANEIDQVADFYARTGAGSTH
jgi:cytochrome c553